MPENIAYGVTITPPDGEPVTGTARPGFDYTKDFAVVAKLSGSIFPLRECHAENNPNNYNVSVTYNGNASMLNVVLPQSTYYLKVVAQRTSSTTPTSCMIFTEHPGTGYEADYSIDLNDCATANDNTTLNASNTFNSGEFVFTFGGTMSIRAPANSTCNIIAYLVDIGSSTELNAKNIVSGVNINDVNGSMKKRADNYVYAFGINRTDSPSTFMGVDSNNASWTTGGYGDFTISASGWNIASIYGCGKLASGTSVANGCSFRYTNNTAQTFSGATTATFDVTANSPSVSAVNTNCTRGVCAIFMCCEPAPPAP